MERLALTICALELVGATESQGEHIGHLRSGAKSFRARKRKMQMMAWNTNWKGAVEGHIRTPSEIQGLYRESAALEGTTTKCNVNTRQSTINNVPLTLPKWVIAEQTVMSNIRH